MTLKIVLYILPTFFFISDARRRHNEARFTLPEIPHRNEHAQIKNKLLSMVGQSKSTIDKKMEGIDNVHEFYKNNTIYKIGYMVSYLNKTHDGLKEMYKFLDVKSNEWDVMKILSSYEKMVKTNEFLSEMLKILSNMVMRQKVSDQMKNDSKMEESYLNNNFAWSYYDEDASVN